MAKDTSSRREKFCSDIWRMKKIVLTRQHSQIQGGADPSTKPG